MTTLARFANSLWERFETYKRSLLMKCKKGIAQTKLKARRGGEEVSRRLKAAVIWSKITLLTWWYKHRLRALKLSSVFIALAFILALSRRWSALDTHLSGLEKSVIPGMVIGIGAAITGIIAIAFSLSLFAIQQVADRGTPATVQE